MHRFLIFHGTFKLDIVSHDLHVANGDDALCCADFAKHTPILTRTFPEMTRRLILYIFLGHYHYQYQPD